jgi:hypothetical protein
MVQQGAVGVCGTTSQESLRTPHQPPLNPHPPSPALNSPGGNPPTGLVHAHAASQTTPASGGPQHAASRQPSPARLHRQPPTRAATRPQPAHLRPRCWPCQTPTARCRPAAARSCCCAGGLQGWGPQGSRRRPGGATSHRCRPRHPGKHPAQPEAAGRPPATPLLTPRRLLCGAAGQLAARVAAAAAVAAAAGAVRPLLLLLRRPSPGRGLPLRIGRRAVAATAARLPRSPHREARGRRLRLLLLLLLLRGGRLRRRRAAAAGGGRRAAAVQVAVEQAKVDAAVPRVSDVGRVPLLVVLLRSVLRSGRTGGGGGGGRASQLSRRSRQRRRLRASAASSSPSSSSGSGRVSPCLSSPPQAPSLPSTHPPSAPLLAPHADPPSPAAGAGTPPPAPRWPRWSGPARLRGGAALRAGLRAALRGGGGH